VYVVGSAGNGTVTFGPYAPAAVVKEIVLAKFMPSAPTAARLAKAALALHAYPNPATGQVLLDLTAGGGHLQVLDAMGRTVRQQALPAAAGPCPVSVAGLAPGLYQLHATFATGLAGHATIQVQ
jgi:hypothetical protein